MKRISINKLSELYRKRAEKKIIMPYFQRGKVNYLNLSVHFSRDDREFDLANYDLFEYLLIKNRFKNN